LSSVKKVKKITKSKTLDAKRGTSNLKKHELDIDISLSESEESELALSQV